MANALNILGKPLQLCSGNTGFTREGFCYVPDGDFGNHSVCAVMTDEFLEYSRKQGNDLITPRPEFQFPGLKAGDKWCLCASRWLEAELAGFAPKIIAEATNDACLSVIPKDKLLPYAVERNS